MQEVIAQAGEKNLHQQLVQFVLDTFAWCRTKPEAEKEALELHAARIFDNEEWVDYMAVNRKYRPEVLQTAHLRRVMPECCKQPGMVPQRMVDKGSRGDRMICCPICGRWTAFTVMDTTEAKE